MKKSENCGFKVERWDMVEGRLKFSVGGSRVGWGIVGRLIVVEGGWIFIIFGFIFCFFLDGFKWFFFVERESVLLFGFVCLEVVVFVVFVFVVLVIDGIFRVGFDLVVLFFVDGIWFFVI